MATHRCKHCLKKTIEDAEAVEAPLVLPTSPCLAAGSPCHSWEAIHGDETREPQLQEFVFEVDQVFQFPPSGGGTSLFNRTELVKRMVDTFVSPNQYGRYSSYYFRDAPGSGKTVLMKLFAKELQTRNWVVYMLTAPALDDFPNFYFTNLSKKWAASGKQVAVLVDEVQRNVNSKHWDGLLKVVPPNLLVVGTGIPDLHATSPQFQKKYPSFDSPAITQLTSEDMPEVLSHFIPQGKVDELWEVKKRALNELLEATGGQLFPFVTIAKHLMEPERVKHLSNLSSYLTSKQFFYHKDYVAVRDRCFSMSQDAVELMEKFLLEKIRVQNDTETGIRTGLWTGSGFSSPLLVQEVFRRVVASDQQGVKKHFDLDLTGKKEPIVQQIIEAGLSNMHAIDFVDANFSSLDNNERGLASRWGKAAASVLMDQVWLAPEVVTVLKGPGAKPTIDWVVNGSLNLGLELARDRTDADIAEKLVKVSSGGVYGRHNSYVFHFVLNGTLDDAIRQVETLPVEKRTRVYTFVKDYNVLLCGTQTVRAGVVRKLPSPPSMYPLGSKKQFSTMTLGALRRLGRML